MKLTLPKEKFRQNFSLHSAEAEAETFQHPYSERHMPRSDILLDQFPLILRVGMHPEFNIKVLMRFCLRLKEINVYPITSPHTVTRWGTLGVHCNIKIGISALFCWLILV